MAVKQETLGEEKKDGEETTAPQEPGGEQVAPPKHDDGTDKTPEADAEGAQGPDVEVETVPEPPEAVEEREPLPKQFEFKGVLVGLKAKSTKNGVVQCVTLETRDLQSVRDLAPLLELAFNVDMVLTWEYRPDDQPMAKPTGEEEPDSQEELQLESAEGAEGEADGAGQTVEGDTPPGGEETPTGGEETKPEETAVPEGYEETSYTCGAKDTPGCAGKLYKKPDDEQFIYCVNPNCNMQQWANPDYQEPEL